MTRVGAKDRPGVLPTDIGTCLESPLMMQWTAPTRRHLGAKMLVPFDEPKLLLLANKRSSSHVRGASAYPPTGDIRVAPFVACALLHRHPRRPFLG